MTTVMTTEYRDAYNRGWRYSARSDSGLDWADRKGYTRDDAWMDGYLDQAAGRAKWHLRDCLDHDACGEG